MSKQTFNILLGIVVVIFIGAWFYAGSIKPQYTSPEEAGPEATVDRIRPLGQVVVAGQESTARTAPAAVSSQAPAVSGVAGQVQAAAGDAVEQGAKVVENVRESAGAVVAQLKDAVAAPSKLGQETYATACFACHTTGVAGSPKLGDAEAWAPRIAQGMEVLNKHAIEGYQGSAGMMPAKGGRMDLSDEAVAAAVAYMVEESGGS